MEKEIEQLSVCCNAKMKIVSSNEGTYSRFCFNCKQPFVSKICLMGNDRNHNWKIDTTKDKDYEYCLKCGNYKPKIK